MTIAPTRLSAALAAALAATAGCGTTDSQEPGPYELVEAPVGLDQLRGESVEIERDGDGSYYPRRARIIIHLPWRSGNACASLDPAVTLTLNGQPASDILRGGVSPDTGGFWGGPTCEGSAFATFRVPDAGGPMLLRLAHGDRTAEIAFAAPPIEPVELVAPAGGRARPGEIITLRVPDRFYASRGAVPPTPHAIDRPAEVSDPIGFPHGLFGPRGADLADWTVAKEHGAVGVGEGAVFVEVPSYTPPGAKTFYLAYSFSGQWDPMPIERCQGFAGCTGQSRDNLGVIGPVELIVE